MATSVSERAPLQAYDAANDLRARGFAVFEDLCSPAEVATLKAHIAPIVARVDLPNLYERDQRDLADGITITPAGLTLPRLLNWHPELLELMLRQPVLEAMRNLLGEGFRLEAAGAMVSDSARPFFTWHTHIDGEDEGERYRTGVWPEVTRPERVLTLMYLDLIDEEGGPLLVLPRAVGDPTAPPHPIADETWPGQVELHARPGTLVALEQCTWHAAFARKGPGYRMIIGCYFAAAHTPVAPWQDPELAAVDRDEPWFRALVEPGRV